MRSHKLCRVVVNIAFIAIATACVSERQTRCGSGTELIAGECLPILDGGLSDSGVIIGTVMASCGDHAFLVDGVCHGVQPVGAACERGGECDTQTCLPESDGFPGGYCSIPSCNDLRPCTVGSHCVYSTKDETSICLAFCSGTSECRDGYVCQPVYEGNISVCAPACSRAEDCPDQADCDEASGKCLLRECDPKQSADCGEGRVCFPDSLNITTSGGLCLTTCDPSDSKCRGQDLCQPLPEDPEHAGLCVPPRCKQTLDCSAGSLCVEGVCQPPARCDDKGACGDSATACVGGPGGQCVTKCNDDASCSAIHSGLVCAEGVAKDRVCLPIGSFPGSACRAGTSSACDSLAVNGTSVPMICENDSCLLECGNGGDALCKMVSPALNCASTVFDRAVCLPSGAYPGGPCGGDARDTCSDANLGAGQRSKMLCKDGQCLLDCGAAAIGSSDAGSYCADIDEDLTCAKTVYPGSAVCLPEGSYPGGPCAHGMCSKFADRAMVCDDNTCLVTCTPDSDDSCGAVSPTLGCAHGVLAQDVCLPKGSFPGSACGGPNRDQCAQDLNGVAELDMQCVNGACVISCNEAGKWAGYGEALCSFVDPTLTCAQAANSVCVKACNNGACSNGSSCLDPGTAPQHENACLPNGSFLGAACARGNVCRGSPMLVCVPGNNPTCAPGCNTNNGQQPADDYCAQVGTNLGTGFNRCSSVGNNLNICIKQ